MASFVQSPFIHTETKKNETKSLLKTSNRFLLTSQTYCESIESGLNKISRTCLKIKENKMFND